MARVILHVGMHKTGTSSIQSSLFQSRTALEQANVLYAPLGKNHSVRIYDTFNDKDDLHHRHRRRGIIDTSAVVEAAHADRTLLRERFREHAGADFVISGEGIPRLSTRATYRLLAFLRKFFARIEVVLFVRPPASFIHSQTQQQIKSGTTLERLAGAKFQIMYRQYEKYFDMLPRDAIRTQVFSRATLVDGCAVKTFCRLTGLPEVPTVRANDGLSRPAADFLLVANEILPVFGGDGRPNPSRAPQLNRVRLPGPKFYAPREAVLRGLESSKDEIAWLNRTLGLRIEEYDDGLAVQDFHPGHIEPLERVSLMAQVHKENRRLLGRLAAPA